MFLKILKKSFLTGYPIDEDIKKWFFGYGYANLEGYENSELVLKLQKKLIFLLVTCNYNQNL